MPSRSVRYVFAMLRAFAADTSSGARDRLLILGTDGSELSWDGDRLLLVPSGDEDEDEPDPRVRLGAEWCERQVAERFAAMAAADALVLA